jgi:hypothetical protein
MNWVGPLVHMGRRRAATEHGLSGREIDPVAPARSDGPPPCAAGVCLVATSTSPRFSEFHPRRNHGCCIFGSHHLAEHHHCRQRR